MREKMVALIRQIVIPFWAEQIADHLIQNDVVPVVRCGECKYNGNDEECAMLSMMQYTPEDGFCFCGEKK